jgi:two-component system OmpR family response regulator
MDNTNQQRVLVVEPDPSIRALIVALLRRDGVVTDCVSTHDDALRSASSRHYDAVVVEPRIPDGDALLSELYAAAPDGRPNLVVVTTPDSASKLLRGRAGVRAVLMKPFAVDALTDALAACHDDGS